MAVYKVLIKRSAVKELEAVPKRDRGRVASSIGRLAGEPRPPGCEKLTGQEKYRIRQGRYRVVYAVDDGRLVVLVVKIGHRREIYR